MRPSPVPPPVWAVLFGAGMWALQRYVPLLTLLPAPWPWLGWCVMAIAPIPPVAAIMQFRRAHTTVNPHKPETASALVTSGIYAWTRNPMYLGLSVLLVGWAITLGSLSPLVGPLIFVPLMQQIQIRPEENALRRRFGADYEEYCHRVNRWFSVSEH
jgi:protein-S-isoprenylcysteine O-methyltransferase Ste14